MAYYAVHILYYIVYTARIRDVRHAVYRIINRPSWLSFVSMLYCFLSRLLSIVMPDCVTLLELPGNKIYKYNNYWAIIYEHATLQFRLS